MRHQRVTRLVVREDPLLLLRDHPALLQTGDDPLHRVLEVEMAHVLRAAPPGEDRRFVGDVREVRPGQPGSLPCDRVEVDVGRERLLPRVDSQDGLAARQVRRAHQHLAVEASRPEKSQIQILQPVRRADDDDAGARAEAVELDQQLVQRLILLAVERVPRTSRSHRVELVDEDDRWRVLARFREQLPDPRCAEAGEHLDERRGALRIELRA